MKVIKKDVFHPKLKIKKIKLVGKDFQKKRASKPENQSGRKTTTQKNLKEKDELVEKIREW